MKRVPAILSALAVALTGLGTAVAQAQVVQITPVFEALMSSDVGDERWSILYDPISGTVTGNVFFPEEGSEPAFVWCEDVSTDPESENLEVSCFGADLCDASPCSAREWSFLTDVILPKSFFEAEEYVWEPSGEPVEIAASFFEPPEEGTTAARDSGVQVTLDDARNLVSKDLADARWSITKNNETGDITANVYFSDTGEPSFLFCRPEDATADPLLIQCYTRTDEIGVTPLPEPLPEPEPEPQFTTATYEGRSTCKGQFPDENVFVHLLPGSNFNTCWTCGSSNWKRTVFSISGGRACVKGGVIGIGGDYRGAEKLGEQGCGQYGSRAFDHLGSSYCFSCPEGYRRSLTPGADLSKDDRACVKDF